MSPSTISKTTICFTVLHRTDEPFTNFNENGDGPLDNSLGEALARSWDGHAVGNITSETTVPVPERRVDKELVALGNDGSFFDEDLDDAHEPPTLPLAHPGSPEETGVGHCGFCNRSIKRVPGGNGPVWIHENSGFKFCAAEEV